MDDRLKERAASLRRAVEYGIQNNKKNMIVDLDLLAEMFRGNVPVGGNEYPPEDVNAMLYDEKVRRVYYQNIVYSVCNQLDRIFSKRPGNGVVCGTVDAPSVQVQEAMAVVATRCQEWAEQKAAAQLGDEPYIPAGTYFKDDLDGGRLVGKTPLPRPPSKVAIEIAARVWCDQEMRKCTMDANAAEEIAVIVDRVRRECADRQSYDDLAASGGIVDAP